MMVFARDDRYDLVVIGGGINGVGIACDAAGRGLRVFLAEAGDLGGATSSASSKLIHGGLRYLEQFAFRLVREALAEREVLLAKAPHIIWPLRFVLPHVEGMRSKPVLRAGLFLYDHLASRATLPATRAIAFAHDPSGRALQRKLTSGFAYWDCWVDDARLVIANAIAARESGATIVTRSRVTAIRPWDDGWQVSVTGGGGASLVFARAIVNAGGPWAGEIARLIPGRRNEPPPSLRLIKGSHIVVPRIRGGDDAFIFQHSDGRVIFALPFEGAFTLIGTTEVTYAGEPRAVDVSDDEIDYLLDIANRFLASPLSRADIVWQFAGVRPLEDDGQSRASAVSRDYRLDLDNSGSAPVVHVIGGKITTYRKLAEHTLDLLRPTFPASGACRTARQHLPGGDFGDTQDPVAGFDRWVDDFCDRHPTFDRAYLFALARRYGTRADDVIIGARSFADLGTHFGASLTAREVSYLAANEWALTADDVLWRRTKAGLHLTRDERPAAQIAISRALASS